MIRIPSKELPLDLSLKELAPMLELWLSDKRGVLKAENPSNTLEELFVQGSGKSLELTALLALGAQVRLNEEPWIPLKDYLNHSSTGRAEAIQIPEQTIRCSSIFAIPWDGLKPPEITGALCIHGNGTGDLWGQSRLVLGTSEFFILDNLSEAREKGLFHDGESLQDHIMGLQLLGEGNFTANFKAGLIAAQLFALALH